MATLPFAGRPAFAVVVMLYFRCCNETIYRDSNESQSLFRCSNESAIVVAGDLLGYSAGVHHLNKLEFHLIKLE